MQTFLPYPSFQKSAACLDNKRLGKQRVEAKQIYLALQRIKAGGEGGWHNHPAVRMWEGCEFSLLVYASFCCDEWVRRGYQDRLDKDFLDWMAIVYDGGYRKPWWLGKPRFHSSHRAALLQKDYDWYSRFYWDEEPKIDYWWPTKHQEDDR